MAPLSPLMCRTAMSSWRKNIFVLKETIITFDEQGKGEVCVALKDKNDAASTRRAVLWEGIMLNKLMHSVFKLRLIEGALCCVRGFDTRSHREYRASPLRMVPALSWTCRVKWLFNEMDLTSTVSVEAPILRDNPNERVAGCKKWPSTLILPSENPASPVNGDPYT
jgi:hypothetical protein